MFAFRTSATGTNSGGHEESTTAYGPPVWSALLRRLGAEGDPGLIAKPLAANGDSADTATVVTVDGSGQAASCALHSADALAWATLPANASPGWLRMRMTVVRGFAAYLAALDPSAEVPPANLLPGGTRRAVPYLYSAADIAALLIRVGRLKTPLRQETIKTLIGLMAVTGMRGGEVVALDDEDFDPGRGVLLVRHAKLGKHRLLPLHATTVMALQAYRQLRDRRFPRPAWRCPSATGSAARRYHPRGAVAVLPRRRCSSVATSSASSRSACSMRRSAVRSRRPILPLSHETRSLNCAIRTVSVLSARLASIAVRRSSGNRLAVPCTTVTKACRVPAVSSPARSAI